MTVSGSAKWIGGDLPFPAPEITKIAEGDDACRVWPCGPHRCRQSGIARANQAPCVTHHAYEFTGSLTNVQRHDNYAFRHECEIERHPVN